MCNYCVYVHINKLNNKKYVGITCDKPSKRWKCGKGYMHNKYFYSTIEKYGWDIFDHVILIKNISKNLAEELEKYYIRFYKSNEREFGYNIESGGNLGKKVSEETKRKLSEATKKQMTEEARINLREHALKQFELKGHPSLGKKMSEKTKMLQRNKKTCLFKGINQYDLEGNLIKHYDCLHDVERETGFFRSAISNYLKGKSKYCYGFHWEYSEKEEEERTDDN